MLTKRNSKSFKFVLVVMFVFLVVGIVYKPVQKISIDYIAYETESVSVSDGHPSVPSTYGYDALSGDISGSTCEGYLIFVFIVNGEEITFTDEVSSNTYRFVLGADSSTNATAVIPEGTVDITTTIISNANDVLIVIPATSWSSKGTGDLALSNVAVAAEALFTIEAFTAATIEIKLHYDDADFEISAPGLSDSDDFDDLSTGDFSFPIVDMNDYEFEIDEMTAVNMIVYKAITVTTIGNGDGITVSSPSATGVTYVVIDTVANFDYEGLGEYERDQLLPEIGGVGLDTIAGYAFVVLLFIYFLKRRK